MKNFSSRWVILLVWLGWAGLMVGYPVYVRARFQPMRPDTALFWTAAETAANSQAKQPYLLEPFLNEHVAWDSEYYLSIAVGGYADPAMRAIPADFNWETDEVDLQRNQPQWISMNHAFFPFYPLVMRGVAYPLRLLGLNPIAAAALAGMLVSMLGTLGAMLALYDLARDDLGEAGGRRAAFYLLIWPAGMFLAQVYTEGLFVGLAFGALALAHRQKWVWAAVLAVGATWTRAAGALLLLPLVGYWWQAGGLQKLTREFSLREVGKLVLAASPLLAYLLWQALLGQPFHIVEAQFFTRGFLTFERSWAEWQTAWQALWAKNPPGQAYYLVEFAAIGWGLLACGLWLRRQPLLALYSLAVIVFSLTSGSAQGMHRYVMAAPVVFLLPARWGHSETFDRLWTLGSVLLMGVFAAMFSFNFWSG